MGRKKSYKIFEMDYLMNNDLTEDDLYYLFETHSLSYSLVVNMFRFSNQDITDEKKIINLVRTDRDWMYKYFWNKKQREDFENDVKKIYKNIYQCGDNEADSRASWWLFMYGLTNEDLKDNKNINKLCND